MPIVYRVGGIFGTEYFGTAREADRYKPGGEEPETFHRIDAAGECNRLNRMVDETERRLDSVRWLLAELLEVCDPQTVSGTEAGRKAQAYIVANPLPRADSSERDGGRSYGI